MQRHQLGLVWGAFVTAGGSININSFLGFVIFIIGLVVSYRSAVALGMTGAREYCSNLKQQLNPKHSKKRTKPVKTQVPERQAT